jgi:hypothetical protein
MPIALPNARASSSRVPQHGARNGHQDPDDPIDELEDEDEDGDERRRKPRVIAEEGWTRDTFEDRAITKTPGTIESVRIVIKESVLYPDLWNEHS